LPEEELDAVFVADQYAHRQLMHVEALRVARMHPSRINPDGGAQGMGDMYDATGGARFFEAIRQVRGEAGALQVKGAQRVLVHGWRGIPTDSCAIAILDANRRAS